MNRYRKSIEHLADTIDILGFKNAEFCEEMSHQDRTTQQNFTRLCSEWLLMCSQPEYGFDMRNEASHELGVEFIDKIPSRKRYLPLI